MTEQLTVTTTTAPEGFMIEGHHDREVAARAIAAHAQMEYGVGIAEGNVNVGVLVEVDGALTPWAPLPSVDEEAIEPPAGAFDATWYFYPVHMPAPEEA